MATFTADHSADSEAIDLRRLDDDVVELSLLLPGWQLGALEKAARYQGLTTAQIFRGLISDYLNESC
jgi:hypothetical protein